MHVWGAVECAGCALDRVGQGRCSGGRPLSGDTAAGGPVLLGRKNFVPAKLEVDDRVPRDLYPLPRPGSLDKTAAFPRLSRGVRQSHGARSHSWCGGLVELCDLVALSSIAACHGFL